MRNVRDFLSSARRLVLDAEELVEHALPVRALVLEPLRRLGRLEQPQEERAQRGIAAHAAIRLALAQPAAHLGETEVRDRIGLRVARTRARLLDEPVCQQPRELRIDLAVARRPGIRERLLEVLEQRVPGSGLVGECAEECVAKRH